MISQMLKIKVAASVKEEGKEDLSDDSDDGLQLAAGAKKDGKSLDEDSM
jgi:hypothetical protein